jgi:hypothetical protein
VIVKQNGVCQFANLIEAPLGFVTFLPRRVSLPQRRHCSPQQRDDDQRRRRDSSLVSGHKLARSVRKGVLPGDHR